MKYYKVVKDNIHDPKTGYTTVNNELLTEKERFKHFPGLRDSVFTPVQVNKNKTYFFFGARFQMEV